MAKTKATPTEKYWKKRQEELEKKWDKKSREEIEKELRTYYEQSLTHIEKDISALYQRFATDNGMDMAAAQQLLTGKEYRVWRMDIAEYVKEINATGNQELLRELNTLAMRSRITRLDALRAGTLKEMARLSEKSEAAMKKFLKSGYEDFYYHGLYEIGKKRGLQGAVSLVDGEKLERVLRVPWSGKNYSKRIWTNGAKLAKTIQQNIIAAAHRGVSVQEMTRVVRQKMGVGTKEAVRLVRTELNYVQNQAALHSVKDAGMKYYRFIATLDKRTSTVCQSHDGDVFPVEEAMPGKNMPPLHPHCRSVISGCLKGEYKPQSGTRIARDENGKNVFVPANMKYDDWRAVYVDKKLTLEEWKAGNVASQATNTTGALNAGARSGKINVEQELRANATKLQATMSSADYDEYIDLLKDNDKIASLYKHYADSITTVRRATKGGYYEHQTSNLVWSYPEARNVAAGMHKYHTLSHEYGHLFDRCLPTSTLSFKELDAVNAGVLKISDHCVSFCDEFLAAMRADKVHLRKVVTSAVKAEFRANAASAGVQDAIDGLFVNSRIHWGHGEKYYNFYYNHIKKWHRESDLKLVYESLGMDAGNQAKVKAQCRIYQAAVEAWANITSAVTCGGKDLEYVKQYLPHSYQAFMEILEKVTP